MKKFKIVVKPYLALNLKYTILLKIMNIVFIFPCFFIKTKFETNCAHVSLSLPLFSSPEATQSNSRLCR